MLGEHRSPQLADIPQRAELRVVRYREPRAACVPVQRDLSDVPVVAGGRVNAKLLREMRDWLEGHYRSGIFHALSQHPRILSSVRAYIEHAVDIEACDQSSDVFCFRKGADVNR